jgi:transcriptional regulator with XRE-family HTH domain
MNDLFIVKQRLAEAMKYRNISAIELADKSGLNKSTIFRYLKGERIPRAGAIVKLATALRINPSWLVGYEVPMTDNIEPDLIIKQDELTVIIEQLSDKDKDTLKAIAETLLKKSKEVSEDANTDI